MTVTVTGGSGAITYQWQQSADGSTGWANSMEQVQQQQPTHHQVQYQEQLITEYLSMQLTADATRQ
jgi:hypothetical protein